MTNRTHSVRIAAGGSEPVTVGGIKSFELSTDILELADPFSISMPFHELLWPAFDTDSEVQIFIDSTRVLNGFVDRREFVGGKDGVVIDVTGRDKGGRIVDDAAPFENFVGKGVKELGQIVAGDWFAKVSTSNARNRKLIGGKGKTLAGVSREPAIIGPRDAAKKVEPGETRGQVLGHFLEEAGLLAWSSADGDEFIIGKPNYSQVPQFNFFLAAEGSARRNETNVVSIRYAEDVGEVYSEYHVCGSSKGNGPNYGKNVRRRQASAFDGPGANGIGNRFYHPKKLVIADDDIRSTKQAKERANREAALRQGQGESLEIQVEGWGQPFMGNGEPIIFAFDTLAIVEIEEIGFDDICLITRVQFNETKDGGQIATLSMVTLGTELVFS